MGLFSPKIRYEIRELSGIEQRDFEIDEYDSDRESLKELKKLIKSFFENYSCKNCGSNKMEGDGIIVEARKSKLYKYR